VLHAHKRFKLLLLLPFPFVSAQDTPGYGDDLDIMNHINMINGHINACNEKWLQLESARDRTQDLTEVRTTVPSGCSSGLYDHCALHISIVVVQLARLSSVSDCP
jgi:hypothetical protein